MDAGLHLDHGLNVQQLAAEVQRREVGPAPILLHLTEDVIVEDRLSGPGGATAEDAALTS